HDVPNVAVVQKLLWLLRKHLHFRFQRGIEGLGDQYLGTVQVLGVEGRIHRGAEPDVAAARPLPQSKAELELGGGLVDLVRDDGVSAGDEIILEPAAGDSSGDNHHV